MAVKEIESRDQQEEGTRIGHEPAWKFLHIQRRLT